jgi:spore coat protein H
LISITVKIRAWTTILIQRLVMAVMVVSSVCAIRGGAQDTNALLWPGSDLFDDGKLTRIQVEISSEEAKKLRGEARDFVHATITEAGVIYTDVAVHLKGSVGSFRPLDDKPALTLDFARFHPGQRFHQLRRIHLNNSVEDPSYCNEQLGSELFRAAGIPAPRAARALLALNGRKAEIYVLKEGFTEDFLGCYFQHVGGGLFEPGEGHDVNEHLKRASLASNGEAGRAALQKLAVAALTPDPTQRWNKFEAALNTDEFLKFMALEVMIGHRDGYCLARNNFRVYHDIDSGKILFLPHGMDQLFGTAELPWQPHMAGLVSEAVLATPEGAAKYRSTFENLFEKLLRPAVLTNRINQIIETLRPGLEASDFKPVSEAASSLSQRIAQRCAYLRADLSRPALALQQFVDGQSRLSGWIKGQGAEAAQLDEWEVPDKATCLRITTYQETVGAWQTTVLIPPGRYRFEGKARVEKVKALPFGTHQGAGLRIAGIGRWSRYLVDSTDWEALQTQFEVKDKPQEVEFVCELRASAGQACFDESSLKVVQEP